jgi:hypothetical protein
LDFGFWILDFGFWILDTIAKGEAVPFAERLAEKAGYRQRRSELPLTSP